MQHHQEIANLPSSLGLTFSVSIAALDALQSPKTFSDSLCVISPPYGRCQDLGKLAAFGEFNFFRWRSTKPLVPIYGSFGNAGIEAQPCCRGWYLPGCMKYITVCHEILHQ
jgi:hypothetical protein